MTPRGISARIRWDDEPDSIITGRVGTLNADLFRIWPPDDHNPEHILTDALPGGARGPVYGDDPDELKAEAERWLERFVSSLGASFDEEAPS